MLSRLSGLRTVGAAALLAALLAVLLAPAAAAAADSKTITADETLGNDQVYDTFTVKAGGKLRVSQLAADPLKGGWLRIHANTITIEAGAVVTADGAGYVGKNGANGDAPAGSKGGGGLGAMAGFPGGGGAFFNGGANGSSEVTAGTCVDYGSQSLGGMAYFDVKAMTPIPGAAGGAANLPQAAGAGGDGGGGLELDAAVIVIDGMISANGAKPFASGGVGPGGGAGGTIKILTSMLSGTGTLQVLGGAGAHGPGSTNPVNPIAVNNGGGGSGGAIIFSLPSGTMPPSTLTLQLDGGANGDCASTALVGMVISDPLMVACVDLDGDGHYSALCPGNLGDDCDDTDPAIHPGVVEVCDGKDNDCNGKTDDGTSLCSPGNACQAGHCTAIPDAGSGDAGPAADGGAPPDHLEFGGGCALPAMGDGLPAGGAAAAAFALGTLLLAASRRRAGRRGAR